MDEEEERRLRRRRRWKDIIRLRNNDNIIDCFDDMRRTNPLYGYLGAAPLVWALTA